MVKARAQFFESQKKKKIPTDCSSPLRKIHLVDILPTLKIKFYKKTTTKNKKSKKQKKKQKTKPKENKTKNQQNKPFFSIVSQSLHCCKYEPVIINLLRNIFCYFCYILFSFIKKKNQSKDKCIRSTVFF